MKLRIPVIATNRGTWLSQTILCLAAFFLLAPSQPSPAEINSTSTTPIPKEADWTDYGAIFTSGDLGDWDYLLFGGFAGTVTKKNGAYFLYYQGSSGYRSSFDETVGWRAIGVASSPDGINFTKSATNPILTWFPNNELEEGAVSGGVSLDPNGDIVLYYGANTAISPTSVNADGRIAVSTDGLNFSDAGIVLDHTDPSVWGSGDELFPIISFQEAAQWFVYYLPNGSPQSRMLGVAWGPQRDNLPTTSGVTSGGQPVQSWGMGGKARLGTGTYALFLNDVGRSVIEVRTVSPSSPHVLSPPVETYQFSEVQAATVMLDEDTQTWFMYYRGDGHYGVKLAPAGTPDTTPPTAPGAVAASPVSDSQVDLSWNPANDAETGIVQYRVYRDGTPIATIKGWQYSDTGLEELTGYTYQVSAINYHGLEGPLSSPVPVMTLVDITAPSLVSVNASGTTGQLRLRFDEPVEKQSAETSNNYAVSPGVNVLSAARQADPAEVTLTTTSHIDGSYQVTVTGVEDLAATPNTVPAGMSLPYVYTPNPALLGAWTFDIGSGDTAFDRANFGSHGALLYTSSPGPSWSPGKIGASLQFDGLDDMVTIPGTGVLSGATDGSHTLAAWVFPDQLPPNTTVNNERFGLVMRRYTGLYYEPNGTYRVEIHLSDGSRPSVSSGVFPPGAWHHVAAVVDDAAKTLRLFIDGTEAAPSPLAYTGSLADHGGYPYYLGAAEPLTELYEYRLKGRLDEVRIFDTALSVAQIQSEYLWGSAPPPPTATPTASRTPTRTPTPSPTTPPSATPSQTATRTSSPTPTASLSPTPSATLSPTPTQTAAPTSSPTPAASRTPTSSPTTPPTFTATATTSPAASPTPTPLASPTPTATILSTITPTLAPSLTHTITPSATPPATATPSSTPTPAGTPSPTRTGTATSTATAHPSPTASASPAASPTATVEEGASLTPTQVATQPGPNPTATSPITSNPYDHWYYFPYVPR